jgi:hypothetical protein
MSKFIIVALVACALCAMLAAPALAEEGKQTAKAEAKAKVEVKKPEMPSGQKIFMDAKCSMCHTVYSAGIGEPPAEGEKQEEGGPPDLSTAGVGKTAEWLTGFLKKEVLLNDKKHMMAFKGEDRDLQTLVQWILTLKPAEEKGAKAKAATAPAGDSKAAPAPAGDDDAAADKANDNDDGGEDNDNEMNEKGE